MSFSKLALALLTALQAALAGAARENLDALAGQPADIASSAYLYRADRAPEKNPPEAWILLMQYAGLPFEKPVDTNAPAVKQALCGLLWEEVRPLRRLELAWPPNAANQPAPDALVVSWFDAQDDNAHTWWNPRTLKEAGPPEVSADGRTYVYPIPGDTWGVVASVRGSTNASAFAVPTLRALVPDRWKQMEVEIEWGYEKARAALAYDGRLEAYDGRISDLRSLTGDIGTTITGPAAWRSDGQTGQTPTEKATRRRGVRFRLLSMGDSRWRRVWPYHARPEDVARTIVTVWTGSGSFSFLAADLEHGPILAPEYGFFVRTTTRQQRSAAVPADMPPPQKDLLATKVDVIPGVPLMRGWATGEIPWFGSNPTSEQGLAGNLRIPPRSVAMHPLPDRDVGVGWRSPVKGPVRVKASVAMADAKGGNGIEWTLARDTKDRRFILRRGAIGPGGSQNIPAESAAAKPLVTNVEPGDMVSLIVGAKEGNHICDTTVVELSLAEVRIGGSTWELTKEVMDTVLAGNPHADAAGHPAVWHFYSEPCIVWPQPSQPPFVQSSEAKTARDYVHELGARRLATIREQTRAHSEQTWAGAVTAMCGTNLPPHPQPAFVPPMQVDLPDKRLTAQWNLGAWHLLRHSVTNAEGHWRFNDFPFGVLASETYMILRALDLQGNHREAADGLDQWLSLPMQPGPVKGTHEWSKPDRPLGHFSDGSGCLTHAAGPDGAGGHMDAVHCMGPGAIMFALAEHYRLTGDIEWLKFNASRMQANAEWILRQRRLLVGNLPGGDRLWSRGLQPAQVVTPDSLRMHMQFYETEAYYWLAVKAMAEMLRRIDPPEAARLEQEAESYRKDLVAALDRSIALTPVVQVRDGTYHSFIPFAPYVRGFASGAWGWRRCQGHIGAIYWDTVQSADPVISPAGILSPTDPRVQGHLDVLEDRLLLENEKVAARTREFNAATDWFAHASWQYQCGLERHANIHLAASDAPNFIRSMLNQYAVDIMPGEYTFREHTTGGPPDKVFEEACFLERLRMMLIMEEGDRLWLARATPRKWLEQGERIAVKNAPTHFGMAGYEIVSDTGHSRIEATLEFPLRTLPREVLLVLRHPASAAIARVQVNGNAWRDFDAANGFIRLHGLAGTARIQAIYGR
ncbi:MAG: hypothetical protein C5B50_20420 [Verrucomicrobia bacterium]|nr:MAG: hypothetical protein C5B50_20420 [Verrucomicrobiota bacterium]